MTDDNPSAWDEVRLRQRLRETQDSADTEPSPQHDATVLNAACATGDKIRRRANTRSRTRGWLPVSLAAALILGIGIGRGSWMMRDPRVPTVQLTVPSQMPVRGSSGTGTGAGSSVRVEQADPVAWYRYIQELVFSGQTELAEEHLRRFRELHPDLSINREQQE